jgi:hypothetical protein
MANPAGMTSMAGPGRTSSAIPISKTVIPTTKTMTRRTCFDPNVPMRALNFDINVIAKKCRYRTPVATRG